MDYRKSFFGLALCSVVVTNMRHEEYKKLYNGHMTFYCRFVLEFWSSV